MWWNLGREPIEIIGMFEKIIGMLEEIVGMLAWIDLTEMTVTPVLTLKAV